MTQNPNKLAPYLRAISAKIEIILSTRMDLIKNSSDLERVAATQHESDGVFDQIHSSYREKLNLSRDRIEILLQLLGSGVAGRGSRGATDSARSSSSGS